MAEETTQEVSQKWFRVKVILRGIGEPLPLFSQEVAWHSDKSDEFIAIGMAKYGDHLLEEHIAVEWEGIDAPTNGIG